MLLAKSIPQRGIYLLRFENEAMLAVYYTRLFLTPWQHAQGMSLPVNGLNLDAVWENIVRQIVGTSLCDVSNTDTSQVQHAKGMSLQDQIIAAEERAKIERQIAALERQMRSTSQPRRQRELYAEIRKLKGKLT